MPEQNASETVVVADSATVVAPSTTTPATYSPDDLATVRDFAIKANPDAVPELITGNTPAEIAASIAGAKTAYQSVAAKIGTTQTAAAPTAPVVPAGGAPAVVVDPDTLPAAEKIRRGLQKRGT